MIKIKDELIDIIKNEKLKSLFQPIVSITTQRIFSFEALIRGPSDSVLHSPFNLFSYADQHSLSLELEHICRKVSIADYAKLNLPQKLFLNVSPHVLLEPGFKSGETLRFLKEKGIPPERVVIEITEQQPIEDYSLMRGAVEHYREMGFQIALDDLGAGYSSLRVWTELMPDYVKIDRHFIQDINQDPVKLNFVRSIQAMAVASNCQVIAEGIETEAEFLAIEELGIAFAQGYYFDRPTAKPKTKVPKKLFKSSLYSKKLRSYGRTKSIGSIKQTGTVVGPETPVIDVLNLYRKGKTKEFIPIVTKQGLCIGVVCKDQFLEKLFTSQYGLDLYGKKEIGEFVNQAVLSFDENNSLEDVSKQLTAHSKVNTVFIITENDTYKGIGTIMNLLSEITKQQIKNARHANPLTLLPGATPINERIDELLILNQPFAMAFFDLDHFKPFNDEYGYSVGDEAIQLLATLLNESTNKNIDMVGHIGGDDFIVIFAGPSWELNCQAILDKFAARAIKLYKEEHRNNQGISGVDRQGKETFFPILSLSIGIVPPETVGSCKTHVEISDLAAEAKHQSKLMLGNSYFINRRAAIASKAIEERSVEVA